MASGDTLVVWGAAAAIPPTANFATLDVRNGHVVLDFDDTTDESVTFTGVLPSHYGGGGIAAVLTWTATSDSDTGNQVGWSVDAERQPVGFDLDSDDFATAAEAFQNVASASGELKRVTIPLSGTSAFATGEPFRLRVKRLATSDTAVGDVELLTVELRES